MSPDSPSADMNEVSPRIVTKLPLELNNNIPPVNIEMGRTQIHSIDSNSNLKNDVFKEEKLEDKLVKDSFSGPQAERKMFRSSESSSSSETESSESLDVIEPEEEVRTVSENCAAPDKILLQETSSLPELPENPDICPRKRCNYALSEHLVQENRSPREVRSMSDGATSIKLNDYGDITVFPNLQDNVLENMGLLGDGPRDRLTEEEIETKFQTLTLAFTIDAVTLADRRERQLRQRDQAELNMKKEIERLVRAIHRLNPLCVDAEKTELVTSLLSQLDVVDQAATRISTAAEVFGSVQQEWRLAEAFSLMLNHLRNLKQQRDTARRQLQCTKRMLQESTETPSAHGGRQRTQPASGGKQGTRRRASIATIPRPTEAKLIGTNSPTDRRFPRRTSAGCAGEMSPRIWDSRNRLDWNDRLPQSSRTLRPGRFELGVDLGKIREGTVETIQQYEEQCESETDAHDYQTPTAVSDVDSTNEFEFDDQTLKLRDKFVRKLQRFGTTIEERWNTLSEEGTIHEFCCLGAILCFALCTILLGNLMIEMEYAKRGVPVQKIPWAWTTFEEIFAPFIRVNYPNGPPPY